MATKRRQGAGEGGVGRRGERSGQRVGEKTASCNSLPIVQPRYSSVLAVNFNAVYTPSHILRAVNCPSGRITFVSELSISLSALAVSAVSVLRGFPATVPLSIVPFHLLPLSRWECVSNRLHYDFFRTPCWNYFVINNLLPTGRAYLYARLFSSITVGNRETFHSSSKRFTDV